MGLFPIRGPGRRLARRVCCTITVLVVLLLAPSPVRADWLTSRRSSGSSSEATRRWYSPSRTRRRRNRLTYGGSVMWLGNGLFGFEADLGFVPDYFSGDLINSRPPGEPPAVHAARAIEPADNLHGKRRDRGSLVVDRLLAAPVRCRVGSAYPREPHGFQRRIVHVDDIERLQRRRRRDGLRPPPRRRQMGFTLHPGLGPSDRGDCFGGCRLHLWRATMALVLGYSV